MREIFSYFDKIYCINLKSRPDRWENCQKQFSHFGLSNIQRFEAIKCNHPKLSKKANAQVGCTLSHYYILKEAQAKNYSRILVLEDDFLFTKSPEYTKNKLNNTISELPLDWDLFYFGAFFVKGYDYEPTEKYSQNLIKINTGFCTHAISYSIFGINKLIKNLPLETEQQILYFSREYESIDWYLVRSFQKNNKCFATNELLAIQSSGFSDIEGKVFDYSGNFNEAYSRYSF